VFRGGRRFAHYLDGNSSWQGRRGLLKINSDFVSDETGRNVCIDLWRRLAEREDRIVINIGT